MANFPVFLLSPLLPSGQLGLNSGIWIYSFHSLGLPVLVGRTNLYFLDRLSRHKGVGQEGCVHACAGRA